MTTRLQPRIVVTIHGIRTHGLWQKRITPYLARHGLIPYHIDFGWFAACRFFFAPLREAKVAAVRKELLELVAQTGVNRVSVIAHSFGTHLAMEALRRENGALRYDRVVLSGSIVPLDFDWNGAVSKRWLMALRNERSTQDRVVRLAHWVAHNRVASWLSGGLRAGCSGTQAFAQQPPELIDASIEGEHSDTHDGIRFERWARFVAYPHLPDDILEAITTEMQALRQEAATLLEFPPASLRACLFAPIGGSLRIVAGAHDNMNHVPELSLRIESGHGATGVAFETGSPCLVIKTGDRWRGQHLPDKELAKLHPDLKWVLSLPVISPTRSIVVGIVGIDGLGAVPAVFDDVTSEAVKALLMALHLGIAKRFVPRLEAAFRGDTLDIIER